jgi:hypothetical protein
VVTYAHDHEYKTAKQTEDAKVFDATKMSYTHNGGARCVAYMRHRRVFAKLCYIRHPYYRLRFDASCTPIIGAKYTDSAAFCTLISGLMFSHTIDFLLMVMQCDLCHSRKVWNHIN